MFKRHTNLEFLTGKHEYVKPLSDWTYEELDELESVLNTLVS